MQGSETGRQFKDNTRGDGDIVEGRDMNPLSMLKSERTTRDIGGITTAQSSSSEMPFKEQHLKQLRAQCLVFLAFRHSSLPITFFFCIE